MTRPVVLTIAGSDPSGGAGIQADLRTFAALGVTGLSVITALTVQNSRGVQSVHPVGADILAAQLHAIFSDTTFDAIKIGMLGGADQVHVVADALRRYRPRNIVLDPILASTGGVPLLDDAGRQALVSELLPLCDLVTPNQDEAPLLAGACARAVLHKGGHLPGLPVDVLALAGGTIVEFPAEERVDTLHTHGTGCLLSSAIAAFLAQGKSLAESIKAAKAVVTEALLHPVIVGQGRGYPDTAWGVSTPQPSMPFFRTHAERLKLLHGIYVVTGAEIQPERNAEAIAEAAMNGGASVLQLRDKELSTPHLMTLAQKLRAATFPKTLFIINDRVDIAQAVDADGVHLGPDDMPPREARRLVGPSRLVGVSVNSIEEARRAAPWVSYFGVGAIYGSKTKSDAGAAIGVGRIAEIKAAFPHIPIVAIGGINRENIGAVAQAGADAAAVVSAVVSAPDVEQAVRQLGQAFLTRNDFEFVKK